MKKKLLVRRKVSRLRAKTIGQASHKSDKKNDLIFCIGPAGTGKTFLAVVMAIRL